MNLRDSIFAKGEYWKGGYILGSKVEYELSDKSSFIYSVCFSKRQGFVL
jgi:hypothetical protein